VSASVEATLPPGPPGPPLAHAVYWAFRPQSFLETCMRRYGDLFTVRLGYRREGFPPVVFVADPEVGRAVLKAGPDRTEVNRARRSMAALFGPSSFLIADGPEHLRLRRLAGQPFHGRHLAGYEEAIAGIAGRELERWPVGRAFPIRPRMQSITLDVILRVMLGSDVPELRADLHRRVRRLLAMAGTPLAEVALRIPPRVAGISLRAPFEWVLSGIDRVLLEEIRRRRCESLEDRDDLLSLLLRATDDSGRGLTDTEVRDQVVSLVVAGHETTAASLSWAFTHLTRNPEALERLTEECRNGGAGAYLDAVVDETLRLHPPLPITDRTLTAPFRVGGYELPAGVVIAVCLYLLQRRPGDYPDPAAFRPERFLDAGARPDAWLPFGAGARRCLGGSFAPFEMKVVLRTVLARCRLRPAPSAPARMRRRAAVVAPARGGRVVIEHRAAA
jgi:cytochrome P450